MVFVRGGILVGSRDFGTEGNEEEDSKDTNESENEQSLEKKKRKEEKRQRKEARRIRRGEKAQRKAAKKVKREAQAQVTSGSDDNDTETPVCSSSTQDPPSHITYAPEEPVSSSSSSSSEPNSKSIKKDKKLKRKRSIASEVQSEPEVLPAVPKQPPQQIRSGRHVLRGRNIEAKRMAFADMKGLGEIFMRTG
jgi:hypothetical protein